MAVRDALLTLLLPGPRYGFQLHGELAERTGGRRAINVGQTYATLERLAKQDLVEPAGATDDGLPLHRLTRAGRTAAMAWLDGADAAGADPWDETVDRVLLARSLEARGIDPVAIADAERDRWTGRVAAADAAAGSTSARADAASPHDDGPAVAAALAAAADLARGRAVIGWLDAIAAEPPAQWASSAERPRRGRRPGRASGDPANGSPSAGPVAPVSDAQSPASE
ncbi:PadR family transcriptional regulator [Agromyces sp. MMS24-K17]|uniref:PadR family transcriptional regulator n=1 Tax=Agromyces sp. MMS24-K17 TaxID=3372850 RepID=UPI0037543CC5